MEAHLIALVSISQKGLVQGEALCSEANAILLSSAEDVGVIETVWPKCCFLYKEVLGQVERMARVATLLEGRGRQVGEFVKAKQPELSALQERLRATFDQLKIRTVDPAVLKPPSSPRLTRTTPSPSPVQQLGTTLYSFIDDQGVSQVEERIQSELSAISTFYDNIWETRERLVNTTDTIKQRLKFACRDIAVWLISQGSVLEGQEGRHEGEGEGEAEEDDESSPLSFLRKKCMVQERQTIGMADILVSLARHYDQVSAALKVYQSRPDKSVEVDMDITGLHWTVLDRDTDEIPMIIQDITDSLSSIESIADEIHAKRKTFETSWEGLVGCFELVERFGGTMEEVTEGNGTTGIKWDAKNDDDASVDAEWIASSEITAVVQRIESELPALMETTTVYLSELFNLDSYYQTYLESYSHLLLELDRRTKWRQNLQEYVNNITQTLQEGEDQEEAIRRNWWEEHGQYLPEDLCGRLGGHVAGVQVHIQEDRVLEGMELRPELLEEARKHLQASNDTSTQDLLAATGSSRITALHMQDPFDDVKRDVADNLTSLQQLYQSYQRIHATVARNNPDSEELRRTREELTSGLEGAKRDPGRFHLTQEDIKGRRQFVEQCKRDVQQLLAALRSKEHRITISEQEDEWNRGRSRSRQDDNEDFLRDESGQQAILMQEQDTQLDQISGTLTNMKDMAFTINTEIEDHNVLLDELGNQVDKTGSKLKGGLKRIRYILQKEEEAKGGYDTYEDELYREPSSEDDSDAPDSDVEDRMLGHLHYGNPYAIQKQSLLSGGAESEESESGSEADLSSNDDVQSSLDREEEDDQGEERASRLLGLAHIETHAGAQKVEQVPRDDGDSDLDSRYAVEKRKTPDQVLGMPTGVSITAQHGASEDSSASEDSDDEQGAAVQNDAAAFEQESSMLDAVVAPTPKEMMASETQVQVSIGNRDAGKATVPLKVTQYIDIDANVLTPSTTTNDSEDRDFDYLDTMDAGLMKSRYFIDKTVRQQRIEEKRCLNCMKKGHMASNCPIEKCSKCNSLGHNTRECTIDKTCLNCLRRGHLRSNCPERNHSFEERRAMKCFRCHSRMHHSDDCHLIWRVYKEEKSQGILNPIRKWCYFCASQGHFGDDCPALRMITDRQALREVTTAFGDWNCTRNKADKYNRDDNAKKKRKYQDSDRTPEEAHHPPPKPNPHAGLLKKSTADKMRVVIQHGRGKKGGDVNSAFRNPSPAPAVPSKKGKLGESRPGAVLQPSKSGTLQPTRSGKLSGGPASRPNNPAPNLNPNWSQLKQRGGDARLPHPMDLPRNTYPPPPEPLYPPAQSNIVYPPPPPPPQSGPHYANSNDDGLPKPTKKGMLGGGPKPSFRPVQPVAPKPRYKGGYGGY
ncbi:hypothetical protein BZG36_04866 [Bifiguratus adelaidae]|uniref:Autophagy-related protein 17 n=1 Tax=Bifiguratus adelaidae TaxID=1938954 RepID=A0A261XUG4_9FUNG|nr:hypothetical protein BZG36_04866 [Bifiguratus adelaidae]